MKTLQELQELDLPTADCESIGLTIRPKPEAGPEAQAEADALRKAIDEYLKDFAQGPNCPQCGSVLGGLLGTFRFGLMFGEGHCVNCGYPVRAIHNTPDIEGLSLLLPHHPSVLEERSCV